MDAFLERIKCSDIKSVAYQVAWAIRRNELDPEDLQSVLDEHFSCMHYLGLGDKIQAILTGTLTPEEEALVQESSVIDVPLVRAFFRKDYLLDPSPTKKRWRAFLEWFQRTLDPTSTTRTVQTYGHQVYYLPLDYSVKDAANRMNHLLDEARKSWDFPEDPEAAARWEAHLATVRATYASIPEDRALIDLVWSMGSCCEICLNQCIALMPADRPSAVTELRRFSERAWQDEEDEEDKRRYGNEWY